MTDKRLIIMVLGATILLGVIGAFALSFCGKSDAAAFLGIVTTLGGLLCPSPLFDVPPERTPGETVSQTTVATVVQSETTSESN